MNDKHVQVSQETYDRLVRESNLLMALKACGVAEWEGYRDAQRLAFGPRTRPDYE